MGASKRRAVIVVVLAMLIAGHWLNEYRFFGDAPHKRGVVKSVEPAPVNDRGIRQIALVVLEDGETIRAEVLPACNALPGQVASLVGGRSSYFARSYMIMSVVEAK